MMKLEEWRRCNTSINWDGVWNLRLPILKLIEPFLHFTMRMGDIMLPWGTTCSIVELVQVQVFTIFNIISTTPLRSISLSPFQIQIGSNIICNLLLKIVSIFVDATRNIHLSESILDFLWANHQCNSVPRACKFRLPIVWFEDHPH